MDDADTSSQPPRTSPTPPSATSIIISLLLLIAAIATMALFAIPLHNAWFWPTAGVLAISAGLAMLIPLKPK